MLLYPTVADYWNEKHTTHAMTSYIENLARVTPEDYKRMWKEAQEYNEDLLARGSTYALDDAMRERYESCLDPVGDGMIGYIDIGKIDVMLPIYHGTGDDVIQMGVGHLDWTSLPCGGVGTHSVLSSHRGLASARLFTDLDLLREGDLFVLSILNETLTYEVDQIRTVLPTEVEELAIDPEQDYCTLLTCTPYGINTHRLLVRGHRVENESVYLRLVSEAVVIEPVIVAPVVAFPFLFILLMIVMLKKPEQKPSDKRVTVSPQNEEKEEGE